MSVGDSLNLEVGLKIGDDRNRTWVDNYDEGNEGEGVLNCIGDGEP